MKDGGGIISSVLPARCGEKFNMNIADGWYKPCVIRMGVLL